MTKFHGIFSLVLLSAAITMAMIILFNHSWIVALMYMSIVIVSFLCISFFYCTKCCCRIKNCAHVLLGKLTLLMPKRAEGKYNTFDIIATFLSMAAVLFFPQYWIAHIPLVCMIFWLLAGFAFLEIFLFVCTACGNKPCALNRNKTLKSNTKQ